MDLEETTSKKASDLLTASLCVQDLLSNMDNIQVEDPTEEEIEEYNRAESIRLREKEEALFLEDLRLAKCPAKHIRFIENMTSSSIPPLFRLIRKHKNTESFLLCGPNKGKTLSACIWLASQYRSGKSIFYIKGYELCCEITDFRDRKKSRILERAKRVESLVIDDVHNIPSTEQNMTGLAHLLSTRTDGEKDTVLVSSCNPSASVITKCVSELVGNFVTS